MAFDPDLEPDSADVLLRFVNEPLGIDPISTRIGDIIADEYVVMKDHWQPFGFRVWGKLGREWEPDVSPLPVIRELLKQGIQKQ